MEISIWTRKRQTKKNPPAPKALAGFSLLITSKQLVPKQQVRQQQERLEQQRQQQERLEQQRQRLERLEQQLEQLLEPLLVLG